MCQFFFIKYIQKNLDVKRLDVQLLKSLKCFITKISETARNSKNSTFQNASIEYDNQQRVSKVTDPDADRSYLTYTYEKGKIVIKTFNRDDLKYTRSLILNDKNQVIQLAVGYTF